MFVVEGGGRRRQGVGRAWTIGSISVAKRGKGGER